MAAYSLPLPPFTPKNSTLSPLHCHSFLHNVHQFHRNHHFLQNLRQFHHNHHFLQNGHHHLFFKGKKPSIPPTPLPTPPPLLPPIKGSFLDACVALTAFFRPLPAFSEPLLCNCYHCCNSCSFLNTTFVAATITFHPHPPPPSLCHRNTAPSPRRPVAPPPLNRPARRPNADVILRGKFIVLLLRYINFAQ